jgi:hypothetical protein
MLASFFRRLVSVIVLESDDPWASEVTFYSNGAVAVGAFFGFFFGLHLSSALSFVASVALFLLLRFALSHRVPTFVAAVVTTLFLSSTAAALSWMLAQCLEVKLLPEIMACVAALVTAALPVTAYRRMFRVMRPRVA